MDIVLRFYMCSVCKVDEVRLLYEKRSMLINFWPILLSSEINVAMKLMASAASLFDFNSTTP